jgi:hypothetical protein
MLALNAQKTALTSHSAAAKQLKTLTSSPGFIADPISADRCCLKMCGQSNGRLWGHGPARAPPGSAIMRSSLAPDRYLVASAARSWNTETVYAQMMHEWLGVPLESISFVQGDTNEVR